MSRLLHEASGITSYQFSFIPCSWAIGVWRRPHKTTFAFGPFRVSRSTNIPKWKQEGA